MTVSSPRMASTTGSSELDTAWRMLWIVYSKVWPMPSVSMHARSVQPVMGIDRSNESAVVRSCSTESTAAVPAMLKMSSRTILGAATARDGRRAAVEANDAQGVVRTIEARSSLQWR